eukprot:7934171-Alexandrium_andersonii.AAC.1
MSAWMRALVHRCGPAGMQSDRWEGRLAGGRAHQFAHVTSCERVCVWACVRAYVALCCVALRHLASRYVALRRIASRGVALR